MRTQASYRLGEVGEAGRPEEIPPLIYREDLAPGDLAQLMVEFPDETRELWAEVDSVLWPGWYLGRTKSGDQVEFGAEHAFGLSGPRFGATMGVNWSRIFDLWPKPGQEPKKVEPPAGPRPGSIFDIWPKAAPGAAEAGKPEKGRWFDVFRKKPGTELSPIPEPERRHHRSPPPEPKPYHRLPGPPAPEDYEEEVQEAAPGPSRSIIPLEAQATLTPLPEAALELPDSLFDALSPSEGPMPAEGPYRALPAPQASLPGAMILPGTSLPAQASDVDIFSVLGPTPQAPYGLTPEAHYGPPAEMNDVFGALAPVSGEPDIFNTLAPEGPGSGLVVRPSTEISDRSVFDVLEPVEAGPQPVTQYQEHQETIFDQLVPEAPAYAPPQHEAPEAPRRKAAKKKSGWQMPSREEWVKWIKATYKFPDIWDHIYENRDSEGFLDAQLSEAQGGDDQPIIPLETWQYGDWQHIFDFFDIPRSAYEPYLEAIDDEERASGYADEQWQRFQEDFLMPLGDALHDAFNVVKPKDLPGAFVLDDVPEMDQWGLMYYERLDPKKAKGRQKEAVAQRERAEREKKALEKRRKSELKRIWGGTPEPEDLVPWIEEKYDIDRMFRDIQKTVKTKVWKEGLKEYGWNAKSLEVVADLGPNKRKDYEYEVAAYFGIPPDVVTLYEDADSSQELWNDIFWPFFQSLSDAFGMLLPSADLPGIIEVDEDTEDQLGILYHEDEM